MTMYSIPLCILAHSVVWNSGTPLMSLCPLLGSEIWHFTLLLENQQSTAVKFFKKKLHSCCS